MTETQKNVERKVFTIVASIPKGKVATYGQIARLAGLPSHPRLVGRILSQLPVKTSLPWHRVVNRQGFITNPETKTQESKLADEGVMLANSRINLKIYGWDL